MQKLSKIVAVLGVLGMLLSEAAYAEAIHVDLGETTFVLPFQKVNAIELYSFSQKKGFTGAETVLIERANFRFNFGAAPVLGTSKNVPFISLETRLSDKFFDISSNSLYFGLWLGKQSDQKNLTGGIAASIALW